MQMLTNSTSCFIIIDVPMEKKIILYIHTPHTQQLQWVSVVECYQMQVVVVVFVVVRKISTELNCNM